MSEQIKCLIDGEMVERDIDHIELFYNEPDRTVPVLGAGEHVVYVFGSDTPIIIQGLVE